MDWSRYLPNRLREQWCMEYGNGLEEIRARAGGGLELCYGNQRGLWLGKITNHEIQEMLLYLTDYSPYSYEEEMKEGFFTIAGGHRVGVVGHITRKGEAYNQVSIHNMSEICGLNIRIAKQHIGCAKEVLELLYKEKGVCSTLIFAGPGAGKTTILRDLIRLLSYGNQRHRGYKVGVVDERSEIGALYHGVPQNDLGPKTDVLDNCPKQRGILLMLRAMGEEIIAVDELGAKEDYEAVQAALYSGVKVLGTVHADSMQEVERKIQIAQLQNPGLFERYVQIQRGENGKRVYQVYNERLQIICKR